MNKQNKQIGEFLFIATLVGKCWEMKPTKHDHHWSDFLLDSRSKIQCKYGTSMFVKLFILR